MISESIGSWAHDKARALLDLGDLVDIDTDVRRRCEGTQRAETKAATTSLAKKAKTSGVMPQQEGEVKTCVHTDKAPAAIGPYSQATVAGKTAYISGCLGLSAWCREADACRGRH